MLKKIYDVNVFDDSSIIAMIKELNSYTDFILDRFNQLISTLTNGGVSIAKINVEVYDWNGTLGWLSSQINGFYDASQKRGVIKVSDSRAAFVEFGTGIQGSTHPYPGSLFGWVYDTNAHGDHGWWYPAKADDPNPHKREINGQLYAWTKGMPSRPFMYDTAIELDEIVVDYAKEVFGT